MRRALPLDLQVVMWNIAAKNEMAGVIQIGEASVLAGQRHVADKSKRSGAPASQLLEW